jgi:hypothetical protein
LFAPRKAQTSQQGKHRREQEYVPDRRSGCEKLHHENADDGRSKKRRRSPTASLFVRQPG